MRNKDSVEGSESCYVNNAELSQTIYKETRYDAGEINSRHLVRFATPDKTKDTWYWDFETSSWIPCVPVNNLPYGLCSYHLQTDPANLCVVTSTDSYRLVHDLSEAKNSDQMEQERAWREELKTVSTELDFLMAKSDEYVKAVVSRKKADIVPDVLVISPRKTPGQMYGYFFWESSRLAKSCTHTIQFTPIQLADELARETKARLAHEALEADLYKLRHTLPYKCPKKFISGANSGWGLMGKTGFHDIREYYRSLVPYPHELSVEHIVSAFPERKIDMEKTKSPDFKPGLLGMVLLDVQGYQVFYDRETGQVKTRQNPRSPEHRFNIYLEKGDAYFNIRIYGGTWGKLRLMESQDSTIKEIPMELVESPDSSEDNYLTFPDITLANPLFKAMSGAVINIETDGKTYSANRIFIEDKARRKLNIIGNSFAVSWFDSLKTVVCLGHMWQPSIILNYTDLVDVAYVDPPAKETANQVVCQTMI